MEYRRKLPVEITWTDEEQATIDIICDACEKRYIILVTIKRKKLFFDLI